MAGKPQTAEKAAQAQYKRWTVYGHHAVPTPQIFDSEKKAIEYAEKCSKDSWNSHITVIRAEVIWEWERDK